VILHGVAVPGGLDVPLLPAAALLTAAILYTRGARATRSSRPAAAFVAGWFVLGMALVSPLHAAAEAQLSMHMIQHVLIMVVAAPLLVYSRPSGVLLRGLPSRLKPAGARVMRTVRSLQRHTTVLTSCVIQAVLLWTWHMPLLYDAGLRNSGIHALQHTMLFAAALLFWASIPLRSARTEAFAMGRAGAAIAALFVTTLQMGILAGLMTFARVPWYAAYGGDASAAGVSAQLADQQIAGLIMWVPGALPYAIIALSLVRRALRSPHGDRSGHATSYASPQPSRPA
jgi:putative membrane protein